MPLMERLQKLARTRVSGRPVISVYLNTCWAVRRLYVLATFGARERVMEQALATAGEVDVIEDDAALAGVGGVAARLRYAPGATR